MKADYGRFAWTSNVSIPLLDFTQPRLDALVRGLVRHSHAGTGGGGADDSDVRGAGGAHGTRGAHRAGRDSFVLRLGGSLEDRVVYEEFTGGAGALDMWSAFSRSQAAAGSGNETPGSPATDAATGRGRAASARDVPCRPFQQDAGSPLNYTTGCLTLRKWGEILDFCDRVGCKLLMGLNGLFGRRRSPAPGKTASQDGPGHRYSGRWSPANAFFLLYHAKVVFKKPHVILGFELGNELAGEFGIEAHLSAETYAQDYRTLKRLVDLIHPPWALYGVANGFMPDYYRTFLGLVAGDVPDLTLTYHIYSLGPGRDRRPLEAEILNLTSLDAGLRDTGRDVAGVQAELGRDIWVSEGGGAYNSGGPLTTNAFISGFWWLHQLGTLGSRGGTSKYCRQTLLGGFYELVDQQTMDPNADYYLSALWNKMMGRHQVEVGASGGGAELLRVYAGLQDGAGGGPPPGPGPCEDEPPRELTLAVMNWDQSRGAELSFDIADEPPRKAVVRSLELFVFEASGGDLHAQEVILNGRPLTFSENWIQEYGEVVPPAGLGKALVWPRLSYGFVRVSFRSCAPVGEPPLRTTVTYL